MTAPDLLDRLRRLADENGAKARELAALNHPHLAAWYQGQREYEASDHSGQFEGLSQFEDLI
jgi:hypothetical protein